MYPAYHTVPNGPISIYPSDVSINSASAGLFGDCVRFYVTLAVQTGCVDKHVRYFSGTTAGWQLPATCGVQNCHLVFKLTILSINVGSLVDYVLVFSVGVSWSNGYIGHSCYLVDMKQSEYGEKGEIIS